jgi:hypothetical protein
MQAFIEPSSHPRAYAVIAAGRSIVNPPRPV